MRKAGNQTSALALDQGQGKQARAEQRNAGRGQCQEATRDEVVIGHTSLSVAAKNMSPIAASLFDQRTHKYYSNHVHYFGRCLEDMLFSSALR
ncbi:hypothetical protein [Bradyrhizobium sp. 5.13L]